MTDLDLTGNSFKIFQRKEISEIFGFDARNKYEVLDNSNNQLAFIAEGGKTFGATFLRQYFGNLRKFNLHIFNSQREEIAIGNHPFKLYFKKLEVRDKEGKLIALLEKKFTFLRKKFTLTFPGFPNKTLTMTSKIHKIWTFPFKDLTGREVAMVKKKWSGLLKETLMDADNFTIEIKDQNLSKETKLSIILATIFIDILYFENNSMLGS